MALLDVRDLKIAFYDTTPPTEVVKGISFSLEEGETLGIVGESGSGKTQTALSILQLLKENSAVSGGEILYEGSSVAHASSQDLQRIRGKEISMIFQEPMTSLNPVLTIEEQIAEGLLIHESCTPAERHEKVLAIMHEVELPDPEKLCKKYPHQLSGGQRQRVMIAAALITGPKLLIADEPTTALDVTIQSQILKLLKSMEGDAEAADRIVNSLKEDKFVDDLRYASAFAREKASLSGWGTQKITYALICKGIDRQVVTEALSEVDENAAGRKLESVVAAKYRLLAEDPQCKLKLIRFALGRGYGYDEVKSVVDKVMKGES